MLTDAMLHHQRGQPFVNAAAFMWHRNCVVVSMVYMMSDPSWKPSVVMLHEVPSVNCALILTGTSGSSARHTAMKEQQQVAIDRVAAVDVAVSLCATVAYYRLLTTLPFPSKPWENLHEAWGWGCIAFLTQ